MSIVFSQNVFRATVSQQIGEVCSVLESLKKTLSGGSSKQAEGSQSKEICSPSTAN